MAASSNSSLVVPGVFLTLEGPEGSGKSTQARLLANLLRDAGREVVITREPGGSSLGDAVRDLLFRDWPVELTPQTQALLFAASRAQHVAELIRPALARGAVVLCDRFADSSIAYQAGGQGLPEAAIVGLQTFATDGLAPDLRVLLDLPVERGLARRHNEPDQVNRLDREHVDFHRRVRAFYHRLAAENPAGWVVVNADAPVETVFRDILDALENRGLLQFRATLTGINDGLA